MTTFLAIVGGIALFVFGPLFVLCLFVRGLADGGDAEEPESVAVAPKRRFDRAVCEHCLREVAIRKDGSPHLNRHTCHIAPSEAPTEPEVA